MDSIAELDDRIDALRKLLSAETTAPPARRADDLDLFDGHEPAHAAPGPLTDKLRSPDVKSVHQPMHADVS